MSGPAIHASAIVDPGASVAADCVVGPFCVIGPDVVLGEGCTLDSHVVIDGPCRIGPRNRFFPYASIGQRTQDLKYDGEPTHLEIGEGNTFREFVTVHRATASGETTAVGGGGNFLAYAHIAHDCRVGDRVIFSNNGTLAGHVEVDDFAVIGGLTAVHQFCRIGRHAITGGCSKIVQDVPPFFIADGNPAKIRGVNLVGLQRHGYDDERIRIIKEAYKTLYMKNRPLAEATSQLRGQFPDSEDIAALVEFIEASERGIIR